MPAEPHAHTCQHLHCSPFPSKGLAGKGSRPSPRASFISDKAKPCSAFLKSATELYTSWVRPKYICSCWVTVLEKNGVTCNQNAESYFIHILFLIASFFFFFLFFCFPFSVPPLFYHVWTSWPANSKTRYICLSACFVLATTMRHPCSSKYNKRLLSQPLAILAVVTDPLHSGLQHFPFL